MRDALSVDVSQLTDFPCQFWENSLQSIEPISGMRAAIKSDLIQISYSIFKFINKSLTVVCQIDRLISIYEYL